MDRKLKLALALIMAAGTTSAQQVVKPEAAPTVQSESTVNGVKITKNYDDSKSFSPFWIWNDYFASLKSIRGEEVPQEIRASAEQEAVMVKADREFRSQLGEFLRANKAELTTLRAKLGETNTNGAAAEKQLVAIGKEGGVPAKQMTEEIDKAEAGVKPLDQNSPEFKETLARFRAIMQESPDVSVFKATVDKVLTEDQRIEVAKRAKAIASAKPRNEKNEQFEKQIETMVGNYNINNPAIPEHVRQRWTTMTTAQRFKAMRDIERRLKINGGVWDKNLAPQSQATVPTPAPAADPR